MLARLSGATAEHGHLRFHQRAIGNDNRVPIAGFDRGVAPANLFHHALLIVDSDPIAH